MTSRFNLADEDEDDVTAPFQRHRAPFVLAAVLWVVAIAITVAGVWL